MNFYGEFILLFIFIKKTVQKIEFAFSAIKKYENLKTIFQKNHFEHFIVLVVVQKK